MRSGFQAAIAAAALIGAAPASATIFYSNYAPSDTTLVVQQTPIPNDYRLPDASQNFSAVAYLGTYCGSACSFYSATTTFTAGTSFTASHLILPLYRGGSFGNFRIGIGVERFDSVTGAWTSIGGGQFESGNVPGFVNSEIVVPFGVSGARFVDFNYQPVSITAGALHRLTLGWGTGAAGDMRWYLSGAAAATGQSTEYYGGGRFSQANARALAFQPGFAFTDGGALVNAVPAGVPEPESWALMVLGFGLAGVALRRRGARPAHA